MNRLRIFYDSEFTGLNQRTTLISIGLVTVDGNSFYAEFTDFDCEQVDDFIRDEVLANTRWLRKSPAVPSRLASLIPKSLISEQETVCLGNKGYIRKQLLSWLLPLGDVEIWADHVSYDWVLFCELFGGALSLPDHVHWIPRDLCTFLECHGHDPDVNRCEFAGDLADVASSQPHNALYDAHVAMACYRRVILDSASDSMQ